MSARLATSLLDVQPLPRSRRGWRLPAALPHDRVTATASPTPTAREPKPADERGRRYVGTSSRTGSTDSSPLPTPGTAASIRQVVRSHVGSFFKALRPVLGGGPFPYAWAPEWHPGGHGLHVHFAVGRYVPQRLIRDTWGRGIAPHQADRRSAGRVGHRRGSKARRRLPVQVRRQGVRRRSAPPGLHRYEVAQGFQPQSVTYTGRTDDEVVEQAAAQMDGAPSTVWRSSTVEGWHGPPAIWVAWDG